MQDRRKAIGIWTSIIALLAVGCAVTNAPEGWRPSPRAMQTDTHGGWIYVKCASASERKAELGGELIAIGKDSIYVANETLHSVAISSVKSAQLGAYNPHTNEMAGLVFLGTLSSVSNGILLVFTAPLWIIGGSMATRARSFEPILEYPGRALSSFAPFARFPQGLPAGLDRSRITWNRS
jgi:hypothetical protein